MHQPINHSTIAISPIHYGYIMLYHPQPFTNYSPTIPSQHSSKERPNFPCPAPPWPRPPLPPPAPFLPVPLRLPRRRLRSSSASPAVVAAAGWVIHVCMYVSK